MTLKDQINDHIKVTKNLLLMEAQIKEIGEICNQALRRGNKILLAGNGGSAADAQHIAAELVGRFNIERDAYPAIALTTDSSILTSISNDYDFMQIFSRQINGLGKNGDVLLLISTSGNSPNLVHAVAEAKLKKITTIAFLGKGGGDLIEIVDIAICIPSNNTARIQEMHILIGHLLVCEIESNLTNNKSEAY